MSERWQPTEKQFQDFVIRLAGVHNWRVMHTRPALTQRGTWTTPIQGDKGFPDLVLARDGTTIFAELKSEKGRLGDGQQEWLDAIGDNAYLWRPSDLEQIKDVLSGE